MENSQIVTRHAELMYWSVVEDIFSKDYRVQRLKGFGFSSSVEIALWEFPDFEKNSLPFYVFIDELSKISIQSSKLERLRGRQQDESPEKTNLSFMLRVIALCLAANYTCRDSVMLAKEMEVEGADQILSLMSASKGLAEKISKELSFSDPIFFIQDIFGGIRQAQASSAIQKIWESSQAFKKYLKEIKNSEFAQNFFPFSEKLRESFLVHTPASENDKQVGFFEDGILWMDSAGEHSIYSIVFGKMLPRDKKNTLSFVEEMRLYYKQNKSTIESLRGLLLSQIAKNFIEERTKTTDFFLLTAAILGSYSKENVEHLLSQSYNLDVIQSSSDRVYSIVTDEMARSKRGAYLLSPASSSEAHRVLFSNLIEKVSEIYLHGEPAALLPVANSRLKKEEFVIRLSEILKEAYIENIKRSEA